MRITESRLVRLSVFTEPGFRFPQSRSGLPQGEIGFPESRIVLRETRIFSREAKNQVSEAVARIPEAGNVIPESSIRLPESRNQIPLIKISSNGQRPQRRRVGVGCRCRVFSIHIRARSRHEPNGKEAGTQVRQSHRRARQDVQVTQEHGIHQRGAGRDEGACPELKAEKNRADGEKELLATIATMREPDRAMATRLHAIVKASAPALAPKTWYGMPAYANRDGKVVCFFQAAQKFNTRYATFGFSDNANLDEGAMWPVAFALKSLTAAGETRIAALVKQAANGVE